MTSFRALAIIPARGGSKGVPRKNLRLLGGKPLIQWSIEAAHASKRLDRFIVSTDDEEIAEAARAVGAEVPFLRPMEYAQDATPDLPVFQHALRWLEEQEGYRPDAIVHLRPTLPFRPAGLIDAVIDRLSSTGADCVKSIVPVEQHPHKMWRLEGEALLPFQDTPLWRQVGPDYPRQKLEPVYWSAGLVDAIRRETILELESTVGDRVVAFPVEADLLIDLDTERDFMIAEALLQIERDRLINEVTRS
ncbi:MAG TPA: acylneuraminate cytidylyltransferase family protein [Chloroflexota bacterium]|jgi:N-acylneuraminate cytidylyltransferase|nr:acylneuraminate cytidylyltransferase family protein [Chloroflexota bacterium]